MKQPAQGRQTKKAGGQKFTARLFSFVASSLFLRLSFAWFIIQAVFMSLSTRYGIPPDETYHYNLARLFEKNGWLPFIHDQAGFYALGEVKHIPFFLYHYLLSFPLHLIGNWHAIEILRLFNIVLATWSLFLMIRLARRLKVPTLIINLSIFMLVNTLMFVFLSASINYDNLLIPLSLLSFIFLFDFLDRPVFPTFLKLLIVCLAGTMTAINFLPICLSVVAILVYQFIKQPQASQIFTDINLRRSNVILLVAAFVLSMLFLQRYGMNVVRYHALQPGCLRFNSYQQCSQNGIFNRARDLPILTGHHPTPFEHFTDWSWSMRSYTFGILGHKSIDDNKLTRVWTEVFLIGGALTAIRYYRPSRNWNVIIVIGVVYTIALFLQNYSIFYRTGYNYGVQGRYMFIFLPFIYFLFNRYIIEAVRLSKLQVAYVIATLLVFSISALPTYTLKTDSSWYQNNRVAKANSDIHKIELKLTLH